MKTRLLSARDRSLFHQICKRTVNSFCPSVGWNASLIVEIEWFFFFVMQSLMILVSWKVGNLRDGKDGRRSSHFWGEGRGEGVKEKKKKTIRKMLFFAMTSAELWRMGLSTKHYITAVWFPVSGSSACMELFAIFCASLESSWCRSFFRIEIDGIISSPPLPPSFVSLGFSRDVLSLGYIVEMI